ncbi:hypothetical protein A33I_13820 [Alkalihalophilus marmarensis DSM 21297]|uniref:Uncharacterized protein n=1 Tax=Alkalihalophilus marmarensis DSM 21297 TaxID=1188261 RepID=U6SN57_9BACI|nr:hypothetical protein A33I_13820 [Alkalihalophilus marmarensis DSM 21297]
MFSPPFLLECAKKIAFIMPVFRTKKEDEPN